MLCEAVVAVYLSLLLHGLGTHSTNELFRLAAHPLNPRMWAAIFGGGAKIIVKPKRPAEVTPGELNTCSTCTNPQSGSVSVCVSVYSVCESESKLMGGLKLASECVCVTLHCVSAAFVAESAQESPDSPSHTVTPTSHNAQPAYHGDGTVEMATQPESCELGTLTLCVCVCGVQNYFAFFYYIHSSHVCVCNCMHFMCVISLLMCVHACVCSF